MNVIDTVDAHALENGDVISYAGDEIEVIDSLESEDDTRVVFKTHNRNSGMVEPLSLVWDQRVDILGA